MAEISHLPTPHTGKKSDMEKARQREEQLVLVALGFGTVNRKKVLEKRMKSVRIKLVLLSIFALTSILYKLEAKTI